jgi:uncharacterized membrane protein YccC
MSRPSASMRMTTQSELLSGITILSASLLMCAGIGCTIGAMYGAALSVAIGTAVGAAVGVAAASQWRDRGHPRH